MKITRAITRLSACLCLTVGMLTTGSVQAAPGAVTQQPLFVGNSVPPNIFFLTDDSLSMIVEMITPDSAGGGLLTENSIPVDEREDFIHREKTSETGSCTFTDTGYGYLFVLEMQRNTTEAFINDDECNVVAEEEWHARDYTFNRLYYNPNQIYKPWAGVDINGDPYENMDITAARLDPYDPGIGTINLLEDSAVTDRSDGANGARDYYRSDDWRHWCSDNDIRSRCQGWRYYYYDEDGTQQLMWVHDLPASDSSGETNTQTNFANWFTYHRSREYSAKYALSTVISEAAGTRIGFSPINDRDSAVAVEETNPAHRRTIMDNLFNNPPSGFTPLLSALFATGEYFSVDADRAGAILPAPSPILSAAEGGACQMNATILITDGFYDDSGNVPNTIANEDQYSGNGFDGGSFADDYSQTMADIAMHYFEEDLAPALPNRVPRTHKESESISQEFLHQHINTYTIAFGLAGTLDPSIKPTDAGFAGWPDPSPLNNLAEKIDDLRHAAYNGRGEFLSADNPQQLIAALSGAVGGITEDKGSPAKVVFSDYRLNETSKVFSSRFSPADWSGEFTAREVINGEQISEEILWEAAQELQGNSTRNIISFNGQTGIPFQWDNLSLLQQTLLGQGDATDGENRLNYLRGDQSNEGPGGYRERSSLLGDIVSSGPEYVGKPRVLFPNTELFGAPSHLYYDFWREHQERSPVVYVGANDGMLHGFDANTGEEVLAYVPEAVYDNLRLLADPSYTHRFYVDSSAKQFDALFAPRGDGPVAWRTVLTGGLGAGGKAWYLLDVTNPDNFAERRADDIVLWEFGEGDDIADPSDSTELSDVGYSFSQPSVILTNAEKDGHKRWAVVTGNGYNAQSGIAKLFIIFLDADPSDGWQAGPEADYIEISTDFGGPDEEDINGLSSPYPVDTDGDWIADHVYAGDVKGNLWAFDISSTRANRWQVAYRTGSTPQPLFTAINASGDVQPITARPTAIRHPQMRRNNSNTPNVMIYFGTGQYLTSDDPSNTETQSFYAVWDQGRGGLTRDDLTTQTLSTFEGTTTTGEAPAVGLDARFTLSEVNVPYSDATNPLRFGWLLDLDSALASSGERVFTPAYIQHEVVYFTTFQPNANNCGAGGSGWFMTLDALNGGPPPQPVIDLNRNNVVDADDSVFNPEGEVTVTSGTRSDGNGGAASFTGEGVTASPSDSGQTTITRKWSGPGQQNGRLSWKELRP